MICEKCIKDDTESIIKLQRQMINPLNGHSYIFKWDPDRESKNMEDTIVICKNYYECSNGHSFMKQVKIIKKYIDEEF